MSPKQQLFDIAVQLHHETERAWLISTDGTTKVWIPKSQAELEPNEDSTHTLTAPEWLLKDKELL